MRFVYDMYQMAVVAFEFLNVNLVVEKGHDVRCYLILNMVLC